MVGKSSNIVLYIKVLEAHEDCNLLVYEGNPDKVDDEIAAKEVTSFTILGKGFLKIYAT